MFDSYIKPPFRTIFPAYILRKLTHQCRQCFDYYISRVERIFLKPLFRDNFDLFVNNANLGVIAHTSNGTYISIVYRKKCCNLHNAFMVRRLSIGKNNHLTCYSLAINPRSLLKWESIAYQGRQI